MAIVNFQQLFPLIAPDGNVPALSDPLWGYFEFGQRVTMQCGENYAYEEATTFTIAGTFTRSMVSGDNAAAFSALVAKYDALRSLFEQKRLAAAPDELRRWGTASDLRCVVLPSPLVDADGHPIYALAQGLSVERTLFPNLIKYTATLVEATPPAAKLQVNGQWLDHAVVEIALPQPNLVRHQLVGANGEVFQLLHYYPLKVGVRGMLPVNDPQDALGNPVKQLLQACEAGRITLAVATRAGQEQELWKDMDLDEGGVEIAYREEAAEVAFQARE